MKKNPEKFNVVNIVGFLLIWSLILATFFYLRHRESVFTKGVRYVYCNEFSHLIGYCAYDRGDLFVYINDTIKFNYRQKYFLQMKVKNMIENGAILHKNAKSDTIIIKGSGQEVIGFVPTCNCTKNDIVDFSGISK